VPSLHTGTFIQDPTPPSQAVAPVPWPPPALSSLISQSSREITSQESVWFIGVVATFLGRWVLSLVQYGAAVQQQHSDHRLATALALVCPSWQSDDQMICQC
jgi:hypothetical protein